MLYGPSKEQCHKITVKRQKSFSFKHSNSCRKSLSHLCVSAILSAISAEDATIKPQDYLLFLLVGMCWQTLLAASNNVIAAISRILDSFPCSVASFSCLTVDSPSWSCEKFVFDAILCSCSLAFCKWNLALSLLLNLFANLRCSLLPSHIGKIDSPSWICSNLEFALLLLSCSLVLLLVSWLLLSCFCLMILQISCTLSIPFHIGPLLLPVHSLAMLSLPFAMLSFSCNLPSPVTLLLDLSPNLLCSLNFFSGQIVASPCSFSGNIMFAALSLYPSIPSLVTIPFDLFANLPCPLNFFSYWVVSSPSWFCANVKFSLLLLSCLLPSLVSESTLAVALLFDLFADLPCSLNSFSHQTIASPS